MGGGRADGPHGAAVAGASETVGGFTPKTGPGPYRSDCTPVAQALSPTIEAIWFPRNASHQAACRGRSSQSIP